MFDDRVFGNPEIDRKSFVSRRAEIIGRVIIERHVIIAPKVSLRADEGAPFRVCEGSNVQDGVIFHGLLDEFVTVDGQDYSIWVGPECSIGHGALIHGPALIGSRTFVGFKAVVHAARIGQGCHLGIGSIVSGVVVDHGRAVPDGGVITTQEQADALPCPSPEKAAFNEKVVAYNRKLVRKYIERLKMQYNLD